MKVILDTNVLLVSISERSRLHWVFKALVDKQYELCVSTDILSEYAEIIEAHMGKETSWTTMGVIENLANVHFVTKFFNFDLLKDKDDDKFVDCAKNSPGDVAQCARQDDPNQELSSHKTVQVGQHAAFVGTAVFYFQKR